MVIFKRSGKPAHPAGIGSLAFAARYRFFSFYD